jgi:hypothetical protein
MDIAIRLIEIIGCFLFADFCSGFFHWLEDSYGGPDWPIVGLYVTRPNIIHHYDPRHFVKGNSWFGRMRALAILAFFLISMAVVFNFLTWQFCLCVGIGINANEVHKWSHCSAPENGNLITWLQHLGILQSSKHHARHHSGNRNTHYCVITNYLNPILESISFWRILEEVVLIIGRMEKRPDPSLRFITKSDGDWLS